MNDLLTNETIQTVAWFIALLELILALYIVLLNPRHTSNRHVGFLLLLFSVNSVAMGTLVGATTAAEALLPTQLLSATTASIQVGLLLTALVLLFPQRLQGRWGGLKWLLYAFLMLPITLILIDVIWEKTLWYSGFVAFRYTGGYMPVSDVTDGDLARRLRPFYMNVLPLLTFIPLFWAALRRPQTAGSDRSFAPLTRRLAWTLITVQFLAVAVQFGLRPFLLGGATATISSAIFALGYAYTAFWQLVSERRVQRGRLRPRLIGLSLVVALPILVALIAFVLLQSLAVIEVQNFEKLGATNRLLVTGMELWLDFNVKALRQLATHPDIRNMDPVQQQSTLAAMQRVYPSIYLVSTTDLKGMNVARSDGGALIDYSDRNWFKQSRLGVPVVFEVVVGRTSGQPALVVAMPIRDRLAYPVGVAMFATTLDQLNQDIAATRFGETGLAYVVDAENRIVLHPDPTTRGVIIDLQDDPVIARMRERRENEFSIIDANGERWQAYVQVLNNGWGVVVQQKWSELQTPLTQISNAGVLGAFLGALLLSSLTFFTMRQAFVPIDTLTATAAAIVEGDLTREAPVISADELGGLARVFNSMTAQLRELIGTLEQRVASRTADLEQRSAYLQASAEVSRAAASILDPDVLIRQVVELIRERFGLYYAGLFLVDETRTWAVLRSGTGEVGQAMLARQHRIRVGEGMIGWCIENAQARVASYAEVDAVRVINPELPDTRSEAALPLRSRGQVLGALSVQSVQPDAFDEATLTVLQTMVDQVAITIDNAGLLAQAQEALEAERRAYGSQIRQDWGLLTRTRAVTGYVGARALTAAAAGDAESNVILFPAQGEWSLEMHTARRTRRSAPGHSDGMPTLAVPILVRDQVVGVLNFSKSQDATGLSADINWTREEVTLLEALAEQMGQALESARLYRQTQLRAAREGVIREISDQMQRAADLSALMRITTETLNKTLGGSRVYVHWGAQAQGAAQTGQPDHRQPDGGDNGEAK